MALNIKKLENLPHPTKEINSDQTPVERPHSSCEGHDDYQQANNDSKRFSLIMSFVEKLRKRRKAGSKKADLYLVESEKQAVNKPIKKPIKKKLADAIKRLNIL